MSEDFLKLAQSSNSWAFKEATKLLKSLNNKTPAKGYVLFETGYGPSGLPHIGTFGEIVRTSMVKHAFEAICDIPTKLICISDDYDGLRKIPDIIKNPEEYERYIDFPLAAIPDPFNECSSYSEQMNNRMQSFLSKYGFECELISSASYYKQGKYNEFLIKVLEKFDEIMAIMLPTLGEERQATYSPFMPICPETGKVLQVPTLERHLDTAEITFKNYNGNIIRQKITDGLCKLQWKPDFGMRWAALAVDFEMYGKDHLVNGPIYSKICRTLGVNPPQQMNFELFLDQEGKKISKSKGNGISLEEWFKHGTEESLAYYMYLAPQKAKKLYFETIPKSMDDYLKLLANYHESTDKEKLSSPIYHVYNGKVPAIKIPISYSLLLNLVSACNTSDEEVIWGYINQVAGNLNADEKALMKQMIAFAINYYNDYVKNTKSFRNPTSLEKEAFTEMKNVLSKLDESATNEEIQNELYRIGREHNFEIKDWFMTLYEVLLGAKSGPRFGSFIKLYGINKTIELIEDKALTSSFSIKLRGANSLEEDNTSAR